MRGKREGRHQTQKLGFAYSWIGRYRLSAMDWRSKLGSVVDIYINGRSSGSSRNYISDKEFTHTVTIIVLSSAAFGEGIGQCIIQAFRG